MPNLGTDSIHNGPIISSNNNQLIDIIQNNRQATFSSLWEFSMDVNIGLMLDKYFYTYVMRFAEATFCRPAAIMATEIIMECVGIFWMGASKSFIITRFPLKLRMMYCEIWSRHFITEYRGDTQLTWVMSLLPTCSPGNENFSVGFHECPLPFIHLT